VADVLLLFLEGSETLGVTEIARKLGVHKTIIHRILGSLVSRQLLVRDERSRRYKLGPAAAALGARALRASDLRQAALPVMRRLQQETGETATVSALMGTSRVYIDQIISPNEVKVAVEIGRQFPLHAGASSKAILAFAPSDVIEFVFARPLETLTPKTEVDPGSLRRQLARVAEEGVAVSFGERQRATGSVAAPVFGVDGYAIGSVSVCAPVQSFGPEVVKQLHPLIREASREISLRLGWGGAAPTYPWLSETKADDESETGA